MSVPYRCSVGFDAFSAASLGGPDCLDVLYVGCMLTVSDAGGD